jgi:hypothetical protein
VRGAPPRPPAFKTLHRGVFDWRMGTQFLHKTLNTKDLWQLPCGQRAVLGIVFFENLLLRLCIGQVLYQVAGTDRAGIVVSVSYGNGRFLTVQKFLFKNYLRCRSLCCIVSCGTRAFPFCCGFILRLIGRPGAAKYVKD